MDLTKLLQNIRETHQWFSKQAARQINTALTLRNWVIGMYLFEYEQKGEDRAQYGDRLYDEISNRLKNNGIKGAGKRNLYLFKDLYLAYPQIVQTVSAQFKTPDLRLYSLAKQDHLLPMRQPGSSIETDPEILVNRLAFSHFIELLQCDTALKRAFYETETLVNNWSVRELRRAIVPPPQI